MLFFFLAKKTFTRIKHRTSRTRGGWLWFLNMCPESCFLLSVASHIFIEGMRMNQNVYQNVLTTVVKTWIEKDAIGIPYVFQHTWSGGLVGVSGITFWPCYPWYVASKLARLQSSWLLYVGSKVSLIRLSVTNNEGDPRNRIRQAFRKLSPEVIRCACSHFWDRLESELMLKMVSTNKKFLNLSNYNSHNCFSTPILLSHFVKVINSESDFLFNISGHFLKNKTLTITELFSNFSFFTVMVSL